MTIQQVLKEQKKFWENAIFPDDEGDGIEHVDLNYKDFFKKLREDNLSLLKAVVEMVEGMKKSNVLYCKTSEENYNQALADLSAEITSLIEK